MKIAISGNVTSTWSYSLCIRSLAVHLEEAGHDVLLLPDEYHFQGFVEDFRIVKMMRKSKADLKERIVIRMAEGGLQHYGSFSQPRIAYTMLETDRLPEAWVEQLNLMDQVWTPSEWGKGVFEKSGVTVPVFVVPLSVDTDIFKPGLPEIDVFGTEGDIFTVFINSSFGERHNVECALKAYFDTFKRSDPVALLYHGNMRDELRRSGVKLHDYLMGHGVYPKRWLDAPMWGDTGGYYHEHIIARMYNTADLHITTARGHGWNLTSMEAMACGTPTAVTNWSAHTDFVTEENGFLIKVRDMIPAYQSFLHQNYIGAKWADPSLEDTKRVLRRAFNMWEEGNLKYKGEIAHRDVVEKWSWENAIKKAEAALEEL